MQTLSHPPQFDRATGAFTGATLVESAAVAAMQAASRITAPFGHRGHSLPCRAMSLIAPERDMLLRLNEDAVFAIPFADGYWSRLLNKQHHYEEEIEILLRNSADVAYTFIDCGANFGYWSVLVSSAPFGRQRTIAVEASPTNAARLAANAELNGNRFVWINAAIGRTAGGFARIAGHKHEAFSAVPLDHREDGAVDIISLDSLAANQHVDPTRPVVVKLDVEGVEIDALKGASTLMAGAALVICEDHGSDRDHTISRYLAGETPMTVYVYDPAIARFTELRDFATLDRIKRYAWVGYNVFATASPFWQQRLLSVHGP
jgi:FkbM family methyltransferase